MSKESPENRSQVSGEMLVSLAARLYTAYCAEHAGISPHEFCATIGAGVAVWNDLKLDTAYKALAQMPKTATASAGPIRTKSLQQLIDQLASLTMEDGLTGLFNRRYFDHRLYKELQRSQRERIPCSVLLADIDHFKKVNDHYGHDVGDLVLKCVANALQRGLRLSDEVTARFGGEEFAIILPNTSLTNAQRVADRLRRHVWEVGKREAARPGVNLPCATVSIGVSTAYPTQAVSAAQLVKQADIALYDAKQAGRNTIRAHGKPPAHEEIGGVSLQEREALLG